jgi:hypothetical protein
MHKGFKEYLYSHIKITIRIPALLLYIVAGENRCTTQNHMIGTIVVPTQGAQYIGLASQFMLLLQNLKVMTAISSKKALRHQ